MHLRGVTLCLNFGFGTCLPRISTPRKNTFFCYNGQVTSQVLKDSHCKHARSFTDDSEYRTKSTKPQKSRDQNTPGRLGITTAIVISNPILIQVHYLTIPACLPAVDLFTYTVHALLSYHTLPQTLPHVAMYTCIHIPFR